MNLFRSISLILLLAWLSPCQAEGVSEDKIKSAYVLNFAKFVEWPAGVIGTNDKLTLCVVGRDVLGGVLLELDGRNAGGHELHIVLHPTADENLSGCRLVFIGESEQHRAIAIIKALGESSSLTISDIEDFAKKGGDIGLSYRANRITFEVNLASTQKSRLHLPSQLLNLASSVFGK